MGNGTHLQLGSAKPTGARDTAKDTAGKSHRNLELDAQNRLAALFTAGTVMNLSDDCWTVTTSFANVIEVAI